MAKIQKRARAELASRHSRKAYTYIQSEETKLSSDSSYHGRPTSPERFQARKPIVRHHIEVQPATRDGTLRLTEEAHAVTAHLKGLG